MAASPSTSSAHLKGAADGDLQREALRNKYSMASPKQNIEVQCGWRLWTNLKCQASSVSASKMVTYGLGYNNKPQVVSYKLDHLLTWGALPAVFSKPSIFRLRSSLMKQQVVLGVVTLMTYYIMLNCVEELSGGKSTGDESRAYWKRQVNPIVELATYANALVAFLLGLFISLSLSRWWAMRSSFVHGVTKASRNMVFSLAAVLPQPEHDAIRERIARYCLLSNKLLFQCARPDFAEQCLLESVNEGLASKYEVAELQRALRSQDIAPQVSGAVDCDIAEIPWLWNCRLIHILFKAGCFPPPVMALLHRLCLDARNAISGVEMQLNSQLPFAYCHLLTTLVQGAVLLSSVKTGALSALSTSALSVVCLLAFHFCLSMVYLGLLSMSAVIADPFGDDVIDLPARQVQQQLWKGCCTVDAMRKVPDTVKKKKKEHDEDDDDGDDGGDDGGGDGGGDDGGDDGGD